MTPFCRVMFVSVDEKSQWRVVTTDEPELILFARDSQLAAEIYCDCVNKAANRWHRERFVENMDKIPCP
jgi:hypothetical protein